MSRFPHITPRKVAHIPVNKFYRARPYGETVYGVDGCYFYLDAATNVTLNGTQVSSWTDQVQNIRFYNTNATYQPTFVAADAGYNGQPTLSTSGTGFTLLADVGVRLNQDTCIVVVGGMNIITNNPHMIGSGSLNSLYMGGSYGPSANKLSLYLLGTTLKIQSNVVYNVPQIAIITNQYIIQNGTINKFQNYTAFVQSTNFNTIFSSSNGNTTYSLIGEMAEILMFNGKFTESQLLELSDNINTKYLFY